MPPLLTAAREAVASRGIRVSMQTMPRETPATFDGVSVTLNASHDPQSLAFYLLHSFGSIVRWCLDRTAVQTIFDELRDAKVESTDTPRFERALEAFRRFEEQSSEHAVWTLAQIGHAGAIDDYTIFFRADIEAISAFHRTGRAPLWPSFLAEWREAVASGRRPLRPFAPRPVPGFTPLAIERQDVKQELDGR